MMQLCLFCDDLLLSALEAVDRVDLDAFAARPGQLLLDKPRLGGVGCDHTDVHSWRARREERLHEEHKGCRLGRVGV